ncbi:hypothetical protein PoB_004108900 [Plakobranchus ocellatus]|uniref:Uncharacterized protein n=1 Tax=Plakobranchus ocellatus TaxID=259542 RepID=A0AAV4B3G1_9GAST|nr:hypothetical protein PoB_004108900 [Plakobranchus ocellatus]
MLNASCRLYQSQTSDTADKRSEIAANKITAATAVCISHCTVCCTKVGNPPALYLTGLTPDDPRKPAADKDKFIVAKSHRCSQPRPREISVGADEENRVPANKTILPTVIKYSRA